MKKIDSMIGKFLCKSCFFFFVILLLLNIGPAKCAAIDPLFYAGLTRTEYSHFVFIVKQNSEGGFYSLEAPKKEARTLKFLMPVLVVSKFKKDKFDIFLEVLQAIASHSDFDYRPVSINLFSDEEFAKSGNSFELTIDLTAGDAGGKPVDPTLMLQELGLTFFNLGVSGMTVTIKYPGKKVQTAVFTKGDIKLPYFEMKF